MSSLSAAPDDKGVNGHTNGLLDVRGDMCGVFVFSRVLGTHANVQ